MSYEEVKLELDKQLRELRLNNISYPGIPKGVPKFLSEQDRRAILDAILSLKYPDGKPMVAVLSEDQTTPEFLLEGGITPFALVNATRKAMFDANFRRIEEKPE